MWWAASGRQAGNIIEILLIDFILSGLFFLELLVVGLCMMVEKNIGRGVHFCLSIY